MGDSFQKGQILHEDQTLENHQYCLRAVLNTTTNTVDWNLLVCFEEAQSGSGGRFVILSVCELE